MLRTKYMRWERDIVAVRRTWLFSAMSLALVLVPGIVVAETLPQALASAYRSNPALQAERRRLEATDEAVPRALSDFRPRVTAQGDVSREYSDTRSIGVRSRGSRTTGGYSIEVSQSVFNGFRSTNTVKQAEANVLAAREGLRATEQSTLLDAATSFMNVIRDRNIVRLRQNDVRVLNADLRSTSIRLQEGDATLTDVAQARARRARSTAALDLAKANLRSSEASYTGVVGHQPGRLVAPGIRPRSLPRSLPLAIELAVSEHPTVVRAAFVELSAAHEIDIVRGELLPEVNVEGSYGNRYRTSILGGGTESLEVGGRLTVPLYQGGEVFARIRAAKRRREGASKDIDQARVTAKSRVSIAWSQLVAARAQRKAAATEVEANRLALKGVRAEERVGQRTLLDVLDAKQELLESQSRQITTKRDLIVASYTVLEAVGRLTAADIKLAVEQHDPEVYYDLVRPKFWGATVSPNEDYVGYSIPGLE